jgi:hypothetical protein
LNISITTRKRLLVKEQNEWIAKCSSICYTWRWFEKFFLNFFFPKKP